MKRILCAAFLSIFLITLAGCGGDAAPETTVPTSLPETITATESAAVTEPEELLLTDAPSDKVCVGILPTEIGHWRYVVIEDQDAAIAALENAVKAKSSDEWWVKGDQTVGITVCYGGDFWEFVMSGELVNPLGRVKAEDAQPLYDLCFAAAVDAGWKECVYPADISGLTSATLTISTEWNEKYDYIVTQTNPDDLDALEAMLSKGKLALGGTGCPFGALLTMEREIGDPIVIRLATDSCGVWMSQGNYYEFASDSQPLFDLFGVRFDAGKLIQ